MPSAVSLALVRIHVHLHLHLHHHFHGSPVDYASLAAASAASFFGIPGPGEPLLVAAGILAARHQLDLMEVVLVAFAGANTGGIGGWLLGRAGGRTLLTTRGPLQKMRLRALQRGDELFKRHPVMGVVLTPSWVAGIHNLGAWRFASINFISAWVWAGGIGAGAYYAGPAVLDWVNDLGRVTGIALAVLIGAGVAGALLARGRRRRRGRPAGAAAPGAGSADRDPV